MHTILLLCTLDKTISSLRISVLCRMALSLFTASISSKTNAHALHNFRHLARDKEQQTPVDRIGLLTEEPLSAVAFSILNSSNLAHLFWPSSVANIFRILFLISHHTH